MSVPYNNRYSDGNAAYDLHRFNAVEINDDNYHVPAQRLQKKKSLLPVKCAAAFTGLLLAITIVSYFCLCSVSAKTEALEQQLETLAAENDELNRQYERNIDAKMKSIKEAAYSSGLHAPGENQIVGISVSSPDKAEIVND